MKVRISDTRPGSLRERYVMEDGSIFWVDRHGWVLTADKKVMEHPAVDAVMQAITEWDATR